MQQAKAILRVGYTDYVVNLKDAVAVAEVLSRAEMYESKYHTGQGSTHHIYGNESNEFASIKLLSDVFYNMAKLAGKPE